MAVTPKEAYINEKEIIELKDAKGRISGKVISAYPPGLPIVVPGEEISENILNYIYDLKEKREICKVLLMLNVTILKF